MQDWPTQDETLIKQFVNQLSLASYGAAYRSRLRQFQRFVMQRSQKPTFSESVLRAWLRDELKSSPLPLVVHHGQLVNRFLDWLAAGGNIASNPIAELRRKYDCRSSAAILRALTSDQPTKALESLRPPPRYGSHLGPIMREHVNRMRILGLRYRHEGRFLHFDRFLQQRPGAKQEPLTTLIREYAAGSSSAAGKVQRIQLGRVIAKELNRSGLAVASPKRDRMVVQEMLRSRRRPHIYTSEEVRRLLETAQNDPAPRASLGRQPYIRCSSSPTVRDCVLQRSSASSWAMLIWTQIASKCEIRSSSSRGGCRCRPARWPPCVITSRRG